MRAWLPTQVLGGTRPSRLHGEQSGDALYYRMVQVDEAWPGLAASRRPTITAPPPRALQLSRLGRPTPAYFTANELTDSPGNHVSPSPGRLVKTPSPHH